MSYQQTAALPLLSPSYCSENQISNSVPPLSLSLTILADKFADTFPLIYYVDFLLTVGAIIFCFIMSFLCKRGLCLTYVIWPMLTIANPPPWRNLCVLFSYSFLRSPLSAAHMLNLVSNWNDNIVILYEHSMRGAQIFCTHTNLSERTWECIVIGNCDRITQNQGT